jgi:hypothetical protein
MEKSEVSLQLHKQVVEEEVILTAGGNNKRSKPYLVLLALWL